MASAAEWIGLVHFPGSKKEREPRTTALRQPATAVPRTPARIGRETYRIGIPLLSRPEPTAARRRNHQY